MLKNMAVSFRKNRTGILLMICSSFCACAGQLLWKMSSSGNLWMLIPGFALYGLGALIMLYAYKFGSLSVLQPILSLNYVLSLILAATILGETIGALRIIGVFVIIGGVVLIGGGDD